MLAEAATNDQIVVVDFTATWCGPCQYIGPGFEAMAAEFSNALFAKVDVECVPHTLFSIEHLAFFRSAHPFSRSAHEINRRLLISPCCPPCLRTSAPTFCASRRASQ